jgi:hypothetical protein
MNERYFEKKGKKNVELPVKTRPPSLILFSVHLEWDDNKSIKFH